MVLFMSGCMGTRLLKDDQYLLRKQKIKGTQKISKEDLEKLYRQEPNRKFPLVPFAPYVWFYEWGSNNYDPEKIRERKEEITEEFEEKIAQTSSEKKRLKLEEKLRDKIARQDKILEDGNILMRWGEPLAVLDSAIIANTAEQMQLYLKTKGFFEAVADYKVNIKNKKGRVVYQIEEGPASYYDTIVYRTNDTIINKLLEESRRNSLLQEGERYDETAITKERERIDLLLKDNGYFDFNRQYINFDIYDTTQTNALALETIINNPSSGRHKIFTIDTVIFTTDEGKNINRSKRNMKMYNGVSYTFFNEQYSKKILDRRLFIYPNTIYSRSNTTETQRQLANLDMFKFINVYYDTTGGKFAANIFTSPLKKFQTTNELGLGIILSQGFPGPFYNFSLKNRNIFGGLEIMELNGRVGIEGVPAVSDQRNVYSSTEASVNFSLVFPQFIMPLSSRLKSLLGEVNPKTRTVAGYSFTNRPEYERSTFNGSFGYLWQIDNRISYSLTISDLNLIYSPRLDPAFVSYLEELLASGNNLINTFNTSFVSSINFAAVINSNQYGIYDRKASLIKTSAESGGTSLNFLDAGILDSWGLEHYQFIKLNFDYRQYLPLRNNSIAYRINVGIALPYGDNKILPYEKYFFAGGSNGIRAWRPRRLGPGSYTPVDTSGNYDDRFEQPAEIILETSIELRKKLLGFVDGAIFIDAGNSWTFREETLRPNAEFRWNRFYKEIAVGSGAGLRLDFSFLLVRFDLGVKVYDPARSPGNRFILNKGFNKGAFSRADNYILNIGIGYPF